MKITKRQLRRIIREAIQEQSQTAGPPISGDHAISLGGSYGGPPKNKSWKPKTMDIEMEARDTAVNIFKGGGDREEVEASLYELFPELSDYLSTIINDAEELIEFGLR